MNLHLRLQAHALQLHLETRPAQMSPAAFDAVHAPHGGGSAAWIFEQTLWNLEEDADLMQLLDDQISADDLRQLHWVTRLPLPLDNGPTEAMEDDTWVFYSSYEDVDVFLLGDTQLPKALRTQVLTSSEAAALYEGVDWCPWCTLCIFDPDTPSVYQCPSSTAPISTGTLHLYVTRIRQDVMLNAASEAYLWGGTWFDDEDGHIDWTAWLDPIEQTNQALVLRDSGIRLVLKWCGETPLDDTSNSPRIDVGASYACNHLFTSVNSQHLDQLVHDLTNGSMLPTGIDYQCGWIAMACDYNHRTYYLSSRPSAFLCVYNPQVAEQGDAIEVRTVQASAHDSPMEDGDKSWPTSTWDLVWNGDEQSPEYWCRVKVIATRYLPTARISLEQFKRERDDLWDTQDTFVLDASVEFEPGGWGKDAGYFFTAVATHYRLVLEATTATHPDAVAWLERQLQDGDPLFEHNNLEIFRSYVDANYSQGIWSGDGPLVASSTFECGWLYLPPKDGFDLWRIGKYQPSPAAGLIPV